MQSQSDRNFRVNLTSLSKMNLLLSVFAVSFITVFGEQCRPSVILPDPKLGCCGVHLAASHTRDMGDTALNQYPWLALIEDPNGRITCTGALISSRYVLTAAQCGFREPKSIRFGEYNKTNSELDCLMVNGAMKCADRVLTVPIEYMKAYPEFSTQNPRVHDLALIKLKTSVPYTEYIRPICLPISDINTSPPKGLPFTVAGWGSKPSSLQEDDVVKHFVELPYKSLEQCKAAYEKYHPGHFTITNNQICAGGEKDRDSCRGDGGGPLMYEQNGRHTAVGIVSFGPKQCGTNGIPSVYTNVFKYMPWIRSVVRA
ncbi:phenoloxidase-activating enzyme-like [Pieris napi]|uniref:phenoloxidase-activating enzyme-like n=1 Tax=Pieris napi TaxID=78633 RepID=UPI001FB95C2D|nr:phenoloxidase-activating enzyme-like [Pieris napi]